MEIGKHGVWFFLDGMTAPQTAEFARKVEKLGYSALWIPEAVGREPFAHAGYLAAKTDRLIFATGIANIWARDPITMSAASKTVGELSGGRFLLGIGVSHKPLVFNLRGHSYDKPYSYMKDYLPKLKTALYRAPMPKEEVPIVIAALHPKMLALAAAETHGTHTYFVPPEHTAKVRAAIGPKPWICAAQAVILETDAAKARTGRPHVYEDLRTAPAELHQQFEEPRLEGRGLRQRMQRRAGRCDRRMGHRDQDSRAYRGPSQGRGDPRLHPAGKG